MVAAAGARADNGWPDESAEEEETDPASSRLSGLPSGDCSSCSLLPKPSSSTGTIGPPGHSSFIRTLGAGGFSFGASRGGVIFLGARSDIEASSAAARSASSCAEEFLTPAGRPSSLLAPMSGRSGILAFGLVSSASRITHSGDDLSTRLPSDMLLCPAATSRARLVMSCVLELPAAHRVGLPHVVGFRAKNLSLLVGEAGGSLVRCGDPTVSRMAAGADEGCTSGRSCFLPPGSLGVSSDAPFSIMSLRCACGGSALSAASFRSSPLELS
mmetsp:Transcript_42754/g.129931  ORF Transcript_42754/g.129931 Transcript_42754/m.129931 type:complete len:271 (+) Transcript_42754:4731-5543(+)